MKKLTMVLAIAAMSILLVSFASAQTATQTFNLAVNSIYKIAVSGSPADMIITDAVPGSDPTPVTNNLTTYSITHNNKALGAKISASLAPALASGYTLTIALNGQPAVDISTAAKDAVTGIAAGSASARPIAYSFSATAAAGPMASTSETVTLTVTSM
jgi:hypothetical protein